MGILNVTPDSFSDGGQFLEADRAVDHALGLVGEGADLIDIGGESSRPGSERVGPGEQLERVLPVIGGVRGSSDIPISVDTTSSEVARAALDAGADIINDISALRDDDKMAGTVAELGAGVVLMHLRGSPKTMQEDTVYQDLVGEISGFLKERAEVATEAGVPKESIWIDPGIGFGKSVEGNLELVARLSEFDSLGCPVVIGASRKSFIGAVLDRDVEDRLAGSLGVTAYLASKRPNRVHRVHDVREVRDILRIARALEGAAA